MMGETKKNKDHTISIRMEPDLFEVVERIAKEEERTFSQVVRRILRQWTEEQKKGGKKR